MSRVNQRSSMPAEIRLQLAESDLDAHSERFDKLDEKLEGIRKLLVGVLVSATTAALLLAANLLVGTAP